MTVIPEVPLGSLGTPVSRLGLGTYCLTSERDIPHRTALEVVAAARDRGVSLIDTAPLYGAGEAEQIVGEALRDVHPRPFVVDKVGRFEASIVRRRAEEAYRNPALIRAQAEHSLRLLGQDRVDLMLVHETDDPAWWDDPDQAKGPVLDVLDELRAEGRVGHIGLSVRDPERTIALARTGRFDALLYVHYYNLVWQEQGDAVLRVAAEQGMGVLIGAPYRRGMLLDGRPEALAKLTAARKDDVGPGAVERLGRAQRLADDAGLSLAELGLRFVLADERVHSVLVGVENVGQLDQNVEWTCAPPLDADLLAAVRALREVPLGNWG